VVAALNGVLPSFSPREKLPEDRLSKLLQAAGLDRQWPAGFVISCRKPRPGREKRAGAVMPAEALISGPTLMNRGASRVVRLKYNENLRNGLCTSVAGTVALMENGSVLLRMEAAALGLQLK
jgi:hypothetical protein